ncbi:rRNA-processing protein EBP2 [Umbelopsis sp. WA50703]
MSAVENKHEEDINMEEESEIIQDPISLEELDASDIDDEDGDLILEQKVTINNEAALKRITEEFKLKDLPWIEIMSVTSSEPIELDDVHDDLKRELAFYQQALEAAKIGREKVKTAGVPFSRPDDFFAEMVKSDEHMEKIRQRLLDETAAVKASEDAKRQRELKKFGKKVQVEKLQERQKKKTEDMEKIKMLKRKRKGAEDFSTDDFDIELDGGNDDKPNKKGKRGVSNRDKKNAKYGFGGKKRYAKSNTAESSADVGGFNPQKNKAPFKGQAKRPGKAKRAANRGRK